MSPDLYAAWIAAAALIAVIAWACWPKRGDDYRSRNDRRAAAWHVACEGRPEPGVPGNDDGLYLDCVAIYSDCDDLDRLRAIDQHRKEK